MIKENARQPNTYPTQSEEHVSQGLARMRKAAREHKEMKFTALLHHSNVDLLRESFYSLKRKAAPGVDGSRGRSMKPAWKDDSLIFIAEFIAEPIERSPHAECI